MLSMPFRMPCASLLRTITADQSVVRLPGSSFLGSATTLPDGDYVVGAVSTEDYDQIAHRIVVAVTGYPDAPIIPPPKPPADDPIEE